MLKTRISIVFCIALCLGGHISFAADDAKPLHVKVAVLRDFPPQYSTSPNGEPQGFAIDIIKEIATIENLEIEYVVKHDWQEMFDAVKNGEADIIPNQGITEKRKRWFAYSLPVETFQVSVFTRDSQKDIVSAKSLAGKTVAVVKLNVGETLMEKRSDVDIRRFDHVQDALLALLSGNVDALIFPEPVLMKLARDARIEDKIKTVGEPLIEIRRAVSVARSNTVLLNRINEAIEVLMGSEKYSQIYTKWYGRPLPFWNAKNVACFMSAVLVAVVLFMGIWRYRSMLRLNKELKESIKKREVAERKLKESYDTLEQRVEERTSELQQALSEVKTLSGLLPICSFCKKIRDDKGYWNQIEVYIKKPFRCGFQPQHLPGMRQKTLPGAEY